MSSKVVANLERQKYCHERNSAGRRNGQQQEKRLALNRSGLQEKANFLKDEYGIGGSSHAVSGAMGSDEWHDAKGLKLQKEDCSDVFLTWSSVAKHIDELLSKNLYALPRLTK